MYKQSLSHSPTHLLIYSLIQVHERKHTHIDRHTHIHKYTHSYVHTHDYTYIYTH